MKDVNRLALVLCIFWIGTWPAVIAGVVSKVTQEVIEETLERAAQRSGRVLADEALRRSAGETLERLVDTYGDNVVKVVADGGIELLEAAPKYGDEVVELAIKASPAARRAFAQNIADLLPVARRAGVDVLELEAKTPGLAARVFDVFGDDVGRIIAKNVPAEDVPRLLSYAQRADGASTKTLLMKQYQKEGRALFERIPPKLVLATGLTASMLLGTHNATRGIPEVLAKLGDAFKAAPEAAIRNVVAWSTVLLLTVIVILLWRFRLMPWHGRNWRRRTASRRKPAPGEDE